MTAVGLRCLRTALTVLALSCAAASVARAQEDHAAVFLQQWKAAFRDAIARLASDSAEARTAESWSWGVLGCDHVSWADIKEGAHAVFLDLLLNEGAETSGRPAQDSLDLFHAGQWKDPLGFVVLETSGEVLLDMEAVRELERSIPTTGCLPKSMSVRDYLATYAFFLLADGPKTAWSCSIIGDMEGLVWRRLGREIRALLRAEFATGVHSGEVLSAASKQLRSDPDIDKSWILSAVRLGSLLRPSSRDELLMWLRARRSTPLSAEIYAMVKELLLGIPVPEATKDLHLVVSQACQAVEGCLDPDCFVLLGHAWGYGLQMAHWIHGKEVGSYPTDGFWILPRVKEPPYPGFLRHPYPMFFRRPYACEYLLGRYARMPLQAALAILPPDGMQMLRIARWEDERSGPMALAWYEAPTRNGLRRVALLATVGEYAAILESSVRSGSELAACLGGILAEALGALDDGLRVRLSVLEFR